MTPTHIPDTKLYQSKHNHLSFFTHIKTINPSLNFFSKALNPSPNPRLDISTPP